ncbi:MAG: class D sortase [Thermoanaerobaculia bacterium]
MSARVRRIRRRPSAGKRLEWALWIFGLVALAIPIISFARARAYQRQQDLRLQQGLRDQSNAKSSSRAAAPPAPPAAPAAPAAQSSISPSAAAPAIGVPSPVEAVPDVIGRLEIPRLKLSTIVREGVDDATLKLAVGHIPDTPLPWQNGNVGLAGHRDTFFRSLERIRKNDLIRMTTLKGITTYRVESLRIVEPEDVFVLDASAGPVLTLVTCYPFVYVGSAPHRFIVRARGIPEPAVPESPLPAVKVVRGAPNT